LESNIGGSRQSRRRRRRLSSPSSDDERFGGDGGRHVPRRAVARALRREIEKGSRRRIPQKIISAVDGYAVFLDFVSYTVENTDVRYDR